MIQVFPAGKELPLGFYALRNVPRFHDKYDYGSYIFDLDIIRDNAEAALLTELCFRYNLDYRVWDQEDAEEWGDCWEEIVRELFDETEAIADLERLSEQLSPKAGSLCVITSGLFAGRLVRFWFINSSGNYDCRFEDNKEIVVVAPGNLRIQA